jgi:hypothetical protein
MKRILTIMVLVFGLHFSATTMAQGTMRQRPAPPTPVTTENGCLLEEIAGKLSDAYHREKRAREAAINLWRKQVKEEYGPDFAHWKHANRYTKSIQCRKMGSKHYCYAKATPCKNME